MPDDLSGMREEFLIALHGEEEAKTILFMEHQYVANSRRVKRRRLRCLLFGCKSREPCEWWPRCTACAGRCKRCNRGVAPKARLYAG